MQSFDFVAASTVDEAVSLLVGRDGQACLLAGGTDLLVQLREGRRHSSLVIDVKRIPELSSIRFDPGQGLVIGAAASCAQLCADPALAELYPGLVDAFRLIGGAQIQARATVGGNLCNASPAADTIPALIVHSAICNIGGPNGARTIPAEHFCTAPGRTALERGELLVSISVPAPPPGFGAHYLRFIPRNEMDIAEAGAGAAVSLTDDGGRFASARVALAAVGPTPLFVPNAGDFLAGQEVSPENIAEAARMARAAARPISDLRGPAEHRQQLCAVLTARALQKAVERARS